MYQPKLARFMSRDPLPDSGVTVLSPVPDLRRRSTTEAYTQPYVYVFNNPINLADPSGLGICDPGQKLEERQKERKDDAAMSVCEDGVLVGKILIPFDPKTGRLYSFCVLDCMMKHEEVHIEQQFKKWCPDWCKGCDKEGMIPRFTAGTTWEQAECSAYLTERACLMDYFRDPGAGAGCDRIQLLSRIRTIDAGARPRCPNYVWPFPPPEQI